MRFTGHCHPPPHARHPGLRHTWGAPARCAAAGLPHRSSRRTPVTPLSDQDADWGRPGHLAGFSFSRGSPSPSRPTRRRVGAAWPPGAASHRARLQAGDRAASCVQPAPRPAPSSVPQRLRHPHSSLTASRTARYPLPRGVCKTVSCVSSWGPPALRGLSPLWGRGTDAGRPLDRSFGRHARRRAPPPRELGPRRPPFFPRGSLSSRTRSRPAAASGQRWRWGSDAGLSTTSVSRAGAGGLWLGTSPRRRPRCSPHIDPPTLLPLRCPPDLSPAWLRPRALGPHALGCSSPDAPWVGPAAGEGPASCPLCLVMGSRAGRHRTPSSEARGARWVPRRLSRICGPCGWPLSVPHRLGAPTAPAPTPTPSAPRVCSPAPRAPPVTSGQKRPRLRSPLVSPEGPDGAPAQSARHGRWPPCRIPPLWGQRGRVARPPRTSSN